MCSYISENIISKRAETKEPSDSTEAKETIISRALAAWLRPRAALMRGLALACGGLALLRGSPPVTEADTSPRAWVECRPTELTGAASEKMTNRHLQRFLHLFTSETRFLNLIVSV